MNENLFSDKKMKAQQPGSTFLQDAVKAVCPHSQLDQSLQRCLLYLNGHMALHQISVHQYDMETGVIQNFAMATETTTAIMDTQIVVPTVLKRFFQELSAWVRAKGDDIFFMMRFDHFIDDTKEMEAGPVLEALGIGNTSGAVMDIVSNDVEIGFLLVSAKQGFNISEEYLRMIHSLNDLLSMLLRFDMQSRHLKAGLPGSSFLKGSAPEYTPDTVDGGIVGAKGGLKSVIDRVQLVAPLNSTVLLTGETGTGKEMIANAIVKASIRIHHPYIKVNCAAIPSTLLEGELFGHEKGAFTGAIAMKRGYFERAQGGTIFLDEIGELTADAQTRLLRVLQEKEVDRIGGYKPIPLDIRVIAATNRDIEQLVLDGVFREDLYFRLNVFPIEIPSLRNRKADIELLARHFVTSKAREMKLTTVPSISAGEIDKLMGYHWPGNVRELENAIERSLILCQDGPLVFDGLHQSSVSLSRFNPRREQESMDLTVMNIKHIQKALRICEGRINGKHGAARLLNINPSTLRTRMRKLNIPFGKGVC